MLKPILGTLFLIVMMVSFYLFAKYGVSVPAVSTGVMAALIGAIERWFDWLKPLLENRRQAGEDQAKQSEQNYIRSELSKLSSEADEMLDRLIAAYRAGMDGVTQSRADSPRSIVEQDIERWINETPAKLDKLRVGWGSRFKSIGVPTIQQNDIGGGRTHESAGPLRFHREKLAELLADLDR